MAANRVQLWICAPARGDGSSYQYDANGNMIVRTVNGQTFNFSYDAENRIVSMTGAITASFAYDGDGRRAGFVAMN